METPVVGGVSADPWAVTAFVFYLLLVIGIGIAASKFSSTGISEFFIAGRKLKSFVVALSAVVSGRSAWLLVGVTGMSYVRGVSAIWTVVGYILVEALAPLFLGKRLRRYTEQMGNITIPDFFESRFKDTTHLLRVISVLIILIFMVIYVAAQFDAGGKAFSASFGMSKEAGVLLTATIVMLYTLLGGFLAVSLTDVLQAMFMILAMIVVPVIAISDFGGLVRVLETISAQDVLLVDPFALSAGAFIGFVGIGLGSPGNPHILVRYMSITDARQLRFTALVATVWNVVMGWGAIFIGITGRAYFASVKSLPGGDTETLFPFLASQHLHPILFGMVIAAILAAIMSTADSQLLIATSSAVRDVYEKLLAKRDLLSQKRLVTLSRTMVFFLVIVALVLQDLASELVFWLVLFAWGGLGASFGPTLVLSLFWHRATKWGVLAGLIVGTLTTILWNRIPWLSEIVYELVPAFFLSLLSVIIVSLATKPPEGARAELLAIASRYSWTRDQSSKGT